MPSQITGLINNNDWEKFQSTNNNKPKALLFSSHSSTISPLYKYVSVKYPSSSLLHHSPSPSSCCFVLFCFVLFCFVLFCFVLFCFVLFCFVLFCFVCLFIFIYSFVTLNRYSHLFNFAQVTGEKLDSSLVSRYGIKTRPTIVFFAENSASSRVVPGSFTKESLIKILEQNKYEECGRKPNSS